MHFRTKQIHDGIEPDPTTGAILTPIHQSTTFVQPSVDRYMEKGFTYSRSGNPTVRALENKLAALEGGVDAPAFSTGMAYKNNKVAVVLHGCGVYDGTEVHESAATLAALTRHGFEPVPCAPNKPLAHVVNHSNGEEAKEARNVSTESARIARGAVQDLKDIKVSYMSHYFH